jgi:hypothetical protein
MKISRSHVNILCGRIDKFQLCTPRVYPVDEKLAFVLYACLHVVFAYAFKWLVICVIIMNLIYARAVMRPRNK